MGEEREATNVGSTAVGGDKKKCVGAWRRHDVGSASGRMIVSSFPREIQDYPGPGRSEVCYTYSINEGTCVRDDQW